MDSNRHLCIMAFILSCIAAASMAVVSWVETERIDRYQDIIATYEAMPVIEYVYPPCLVTPTPVPPSIPNFDTGEG